MRSDLDVFLRRDLQQYVASEENIEIGTVTSALNRMSAGMSKRGAEPYRGLCLRCGRPENGVLSNGQLFEGAAQGAAPPTGTDCIN